MTANCSDMINEYNHVDLHVLIISLMNIVGIGVPLPLKDSNLLLRLPTNFVDSESYLI
jgi:hypothetical protein